MDDVGVFRTTIEVQNWELRGPSRDFPATLVDTGSEFTWDSTPGARGAGHPCAAQTCFRTRRMTLLGVHSLAGLNLKIDPIRKELVPTGPVITAAA